MSRNVDLHPPLPTTHNFTLLSILSKEKLTGPNYMDYLRNLKMTLRYENKQYVLDNQVPDINKETATPEELAEYTQQTEDTIKFACIMIATMAPELQKTYEDY